MSENPFGFLEEKKEIKKPEKAVKVFSPKQIQERIRQFTNLIAIIVLCLVEAIFGLIIIKDGEIGIKELPTSVLGIVVYIITILVPPIIAVLIFFAFKQEGIKQGHAIPEVKEARDEWLKLVQKDKVIQPRSLKDYMSKTAAKEIITKFTFALILSFIATNIFLGINWSGLLGLVMQLLTALGMGLMKMFQAIEYCENELIIWYKKEAERISNEQIEEAPEIITEIPIETA